MAIPKPQTARVGVPAALIAQQVDELGALEKRLLPYKADLARIEDLRKAVRAHFDASPPLASFQPAGDKFFATVGPRANERTINPAKLIKAVGLKLYATLASVTLKALEAGVSAEIAAGVVSTAATGARPLKTFERIQ